ncbi:unnamed protein product, partial [marine sediment metagenome]
MRLSYGNFKIAAKDLERALNYEGKKVANTTELTNVAYE